ncbi:hypothetical protein J1C56_23235 [Aminobacter anthyllidis]|uniref:Uncharacterized protein n=1 Tax=Aminobacter anthyllidis TaxID=1035067 RepID=A0A9X1AET5_9HYPH|nr:hypothetical protein [Aminobacter anthyllidis]MBT1158511.1 hypothetical protein [Aminobacter anthyllidis]
MPKAHLNAACGRSASHIRDDGLAPLPMRKTVACLIDTAAKIMKSQVVKDPAAALEKAERICKPPPQVT